MSVLGVFALGLFVFICYWIGQGTNGLAAGASYGFFLGSIALYLAPSIIADFRNHPNRTSLQIVNVLLGWTVIGWVGTLAWAYSKKQDVLPEISATTQAGAVVQDAAVTKKCPFCAEEVRGEAIKCKHCGSDLTPIPAIWRTQHRHETSD